MHGLCEDVIPLSESDHDVPRHGHIGLEEDGTHRNDASEHESHAMVLITRREGGHRLPCIGEGGLVLAVEHRTPDHEVMVVHPVELVELGFVPGELDVGVVRLHGCDVALDRFLPLPHPRIDVGGHVDEMTASRHQRPKHVRRG